MTPYTLPKLVKEIGKTFLFAGNEYVNASIAQVVQLATFARSCGFDTVALKKADGGIRYYANVAQLQAYKKAVNDAGTGLIFWGYDYGILFGDKQIHDEATIQQELAEAEGHGVAMADMEVEYNNHPDKALEFAQLVNLPGWMVTTWADPQQQGWAADMRVLYPHTAAIVPQQYTSWLLSQEWQLLQWEGKVLPAVNIWNDALSGASQARMRGHLGFGCWEAQGVLQNPSLARAMNRTFEG